MKCLLSLIVCSLMSTVALASGEASLEATYFPPLTECWHEDEAIDIDLVVEGTGAFMLTVPAMATILKGKGQHNDDLKALETCEARGSCPASVTSIFKSPLFWGIVGGLVVVGTATTIAAHELAKP